MANYGFKISKEGYNVKTAAIKDLIMTSGANQYKIHLKGTATSSSPASITVAHGLSYTPAFLAYYKSASQAYYRYCNTFVRVDPTYLKIEIFSSNDIVSYVIFKDIGA